MKNQLAFIPDNISAISAASIHLHATSRNQPVQLHPDSTDIFIDEILKQRTDKSTKDKEKQQKTSNKAIAHKYLQEFREPNENNILADQRLKQSMKGSRDKQNKFDMLMYLNESIAEKPQLSQLNDSNKKSSATPPSSKHQPQQHLPPSLPEDKLETLNNQSNQNSVNNKEMPEMSERESEKGLRSDSQNKFVLPKVDRISNNQSNNVSAQQSNFIDQKMLKQNTSFHSSQNKDKISPSIENSQIHGTTEHHSDISHSKKTQQLKKSYSKMQKNDQKLNSSNTHQPSNKYSKDLHQLESKIPSNLSGMETPMKMFNEPQQGIYELADNYHQEYKEDQVEYRNIAKAIIDRLNTNENQLQKPKSIDPVMELSESNPRKSTSRVNNPSKSISSKHIMGKDSSQQIKEEVKISLEQDQIQTQYSQFQRDIKILEHRYKSNNAFLISQTQQLERFYYFLVLQQEQIDLKRQIITQQIQNKRQKIQLRTASYSKRYNFIHSIQKNNDQPLQFKTKKPVNEYTLQRCKQIQQEIEQQKKSQIQLDAKLKLLDKYYQLMKNKTICDNLEFPTEYKYDSKLETYSPVKNSNEESKCSIANCFETPVKVLNKSKSPIKFNKSKTMATGIPLQPTVERSPLSVYNLMRYKTQISKEMMLQFQVYNLAKAKRIKDETRLIKKELQFVEEQIVHFDQSFEAEIKKIKELALPKKINYDTFKIKENQTNIYTKSPFSRDYHANDKGMNNINVYRPDPAYTSPRKINKSLSQSKYTIKRESFKDLSLSKRQIQVNQAVSLTNITSKPEFFKTNLNTDEYGLLTMGREGNQIIQSPTKNFIKAFKRPPNTKKALTRFKSETYLKSNKSPEPANNLKLNLSKRSLNESKNQIKSQKDIETSPNIVLTNE